MKYSVRSIALAALVITAVPAADAQSRPAARLTPYVGFLASGHIAEGPFGLNIGNAGAPVYGVQLGLNLTPNLAIVGNVGYADSELEADSRHRRLQLRGQQGPDVRRRTSAAFPGRHRGWHGIVLFVEAGVGAIRTN
jgi:hypothetical protein